MQIMLHNVIFDNFHNYPRKAHKIPIRSPYYTSLWHSFNSKQRTLKLECKDFLAAPGTLNGKKLTEVSFLPYRVKKLNSTLEFCHIYMM